MTVVVWDGITLAADRRAISAGNARPVTKIARIGDSLVGFSGEFAAFGTMKAWLSAGRDPATYPRRGDDYWWSCLVIRPDGTIETFESSPYPIINEQTHYAIGSGRDFALAALHLGCDAKRAVEVACALSVECGNGIDTLTFAG